MISGSLVTGVVSAVFSVPGAFIGVISVISGVPSVNTGVMTRTTHPGFVVEGFDVENSECLQEILTAVNQCLPEDKPRFIHGLHTPGTVPEY